jgi:chemotaxis protein histidine kinase CheA
VASGHEERFRRLFADEAAARLSRLSLAVLDLRAPLPGAPVHRKEVVEAMVRDAHSLKGGAAVVGLPEVSRAASALEDRIDALRLAAGGISPEAAGEVRAALDALRALIDAAVNQT